MHPYLVLLVSAEEDVEGHCGSGRQEKARLVSTKHTRFEVGQKKHSQNVEQGGGWEASRHPSPAKPSMISSMKAR
jgi:hypothetical protein